MFDLHPAVQHLADKGYERMTLDEAAIVNMMRRCLADTYSCYCQIRIWLQQENPLHLHGQELNEWATEVASWVLPTQLRGSHATETRKFPQDSQPEYQDRDSSRQATEASSSD